MYLQFVQSNYNNVLSSVLLFQVHQDCVQRWVDEKLKENLSVKAHCPQCHTQYIIVYDEVSKCFRVSIDDS